jgi:hypothetical protein
MIALFQNIKFISFHKNKGEFPETSIDVKYVLKRSDETC